jgi:acetyl-CoA decarbonylase/synthase complex subunit gamma
MAFAMKVAQGAISVDKCPHMAPESLAKLSEATEPPMKVITVGEHKLGGETVMLRHEKMRKSTRRSGRPWRWITSAAASV